MVFTSPLANGLISLLHLWELHHCFNRTVGNVPFSPPHLWEMHHCLQHICGKCIIVCTSPVSIASIFPVHLWEIHLASTFPVDNASFSLPHQWETRHCKTITSGRCLKFGKYIIVSTSPVGYILSLANSSWSTHRLRVGYTSFSLPWMRLMKHFLDLTYGIL